MSKLAVRSQGSISVRASTPVHFLSLYLNIASLSLGVRPPQAEKKSDEQKEEEVVVHSDLWKTLFRGGYMVGRLTRSLSGAVYVSVLYQMSV